MRLRSLSVALLAGVVLVPVSASAASAADVRPGVTAASKTYKNSEAKRQRRTARTTTVARPRTTAPQPVTTAPLVTVPVVPVPVVTAPVLPVLTAPAPRPASASSYADRVLALTNAERTSRGLRALAFSSCADGFAGSWASALAKAGSLSHQEMSPILSACDARRVGENVAYGNVSPEQLVQMWMDSAGHRANILNAAFTHLGVGDVTTSTGRVYGVQVFLTL